MSKISEALNMLIDRKLSRFEIYSIVGTVSNVNESARTCDVTPIKKGGIIYDVRLQSVLNSTKGIVQIPKDASKVIVTFLSKNNGFVSLCEDVDKILINTDLVKFNGGINGELINIDSLTNDLNQLVSEVNDIKTKWNAFAAAYAPGSPSAVGTPSSALTAGAISNFNKDNYKDIKVTH